MLDVLNLLALFIALVLIIYSIPKIIAFGGNIYIFIYLIFSLLYIYPLSIDLYEGKSADYGHLVNITKAVKYEDVNIIYSSFIIYFSLIFGYYIVKSGKKPLFINELNELQVSFFNKFKIIFFILIFLPILLFIFAPEKEKYLIYGFVGLRNFNDTEYFSYITTAVNLSIISIFLILLLKNKSFLYSLRYLPILSVNIWLNGKRNVFILVLFFLVFLLIKDKSIKPVIKILIISFSLFLTIAYFNFYKTIKVELNSKENDRIENYRDHTVKFAIYSDIYPENNKILEYKGQSFLFYVAFFIPREFWEDKPLPYAQYITASALNTHPQLFGWGITNSIIDEIICNTSIFSLIFIPFLFIGIIKFGMSSNDNFGYIFTILIISLLLTVEITAYIAIYFIFFFYIKYSKNNQKKLTYDWT